MKVQGEHRLKDFFEFAAGAIEAEDTFILNTLSVFPSYARWHHSVTVLYETTIAYIILRALWKAGVPYVVWSEIPYPDSPAAKLDLGIYDATPDGLPQSDSSLVAAIELKWMELKGIKDNSRQYRKIWKDILKLLRFNTAQSRYLLLLSCGHALIELGPAVANVLARRFGPRQLSFEELLNEVPTRSPEHKAFCLAHFDKASEVLWTEFDTHAGPQTARRIRLSLIEVALK